MRENTELKVKLAASETAFAVSKATVDQYGDAKEHNVELVTKLATVETRVRAETEKDLLRAVALVVAEKLENVERENTELKVKLAITSNEKERTTILKNQLIIMEEENTELKDKLDVVGKNGTSLKVKLATTEDDLSRAQAELPKSNDKLLGCVIVTSELKDDKAKVELQLARSDSKLDCLATQLVEARAAAKLDQEISETNKKEIDDSKNQLAKAQARAECSKPVIPSIIHSAKIPVLHKKIDSAPKFMEWYMEFAANLPALDKMNDNLKMWYVYQKMHPYSVKANKNDDPDGCYTNATAKKVLDRLPGYISDEPVEKFKDVNDMLQFIAGKAFDMDMRPFL